jgi:hypothetical protein
MSVVLRPAYGVFSIPSNIRYNEQNHTTNVERHSLTAWSLFAFMDFFTRTLVSSNSANILASKLLRTSGFTNMMPFGETS